VDFIAIPSLFVEQVIGEPTGAGRAIGGPVIETTEIAFDE